MSYLTIHKMTGNAGELARRKESKMDPAIRRRAGEFGAIVSVTATSPEDLVVANLWESRAGAEEFTGLPEIREANGASGLPTPSSFERYEEARYERYQRTQAPRYCGSVVYPRKEGRFDLNYFAQRHAPMFASLLGDNCVRYEVHKSLETPGAPASTFIAAAYFWVNSAEAFGAVLAQHGDQIYGDIKNFTDIEPSRSWAEVIPAAEPGLIEAAPLEPETKEIPR